MSSELTSLSAREMADRLNRREISPLEAVEAALARIERVDGDVNAVPVRCAERARAAARAMMQDRPEPPGDGRGWLAGLPVVIKDMAEVEGVRTTYGSPIFKDHVPAASAIHVERLERQGAIVIGKSNTPEFAAGANTFNEVYGKTLNPWDTALTCGGSSGGSAVALATGMAWLADGSDLGGSLRTPASFCGVVGLRPSPGRVPNSMYEAAFQTLDVVGPMARDVRDTALMLDAMAGHDPRDPLSFDAPEVPFARAVETPPELGRVAFSADLGGITPVDPEVAHLCRQAAARLGECGAVVVEDLCPDFSRAVETFTALRAELFVAARAPLLDRYRDQLKPEVVWNIERGLELSAGDIGLAERRRGALRRSVARFFETHDLLLCPAAIVPPFDVDTRYVERVGGHSFASYVDWLTITFAITLTGCPALSLPCGVTSRGLPVGLQIVGPPRGEARLLAAAAMLEEVLDLGLGLPVDPRRPG